MPVPTIPQRLSRSGSAGSPPDMWLMWLATSYVRAVTRAPPFLPGSLLPFITHLTALERPEKTEFFIQKKHLIRGRPGATVGKTTLTIAVNYIFRWGERTNGLVIGALHEPCTTNGWI